MARQAKKQSIGLQSPYLSVSIGTVRKRVHSQQLLDGGNHWVWRGVVRVQFSEGMSEGCLSDELHAGTRKPVHHINSNVVTTSGLSYDVPQL